MEHFSGETKTSRKEGELFLPLCQIVRIYFFSEALEAQVFTKQLEKGYARVECTRET